jgi:hypothetical protein
LGSSERKWSVVALAMATANLAAHDQSTEFHEPEQAEIERGLRATLSGMLSRSQGGPSLSRPVVPMWRTCSHRVDRVNKAILKWNFFVTDCMHRRIGPGDAVTSPTGIITDEIRATYPVGKARRAWTLSSIQSTSDLSNLPSETAALRTSSGKLRPGKLRNCARKASFPLDDKRLILLSTVGPVGTAIARQMSGLFASDCPPMRKPSGH